MLLRYASSMCSGYSPKAHAQAVSIAGAQFWICLKSRNFSRRLRPCRLLAPLSAAKNLVSYEHSINIFAAPRLKRAKTLRLTVTLVRLRKYTPFPRTVPSPSRRICATLTA